MGEKSTFWGIPSVALGNIDLEQVVDIAQPSDWEIPSDIKGSIKADCCKYGEISLSFDVQLTKKDIVKLKQVFRKNNRLPRKLKKAIKKCLSKSLAKSTKDIKFSFRL